MTKTTTKPAAKKSTKATRRTSSSPKQTANPDPTSRLTDQLKELRLPTIRDQFQEAASRAATENLSHLHYLSELTTLG